MSITNSRTSAYVIGNRRVQSVFAAMLFMIGVAGVAYAGIDGLRVICDICARGPADIEPVCGDRAICEPGEICVSVARDFDSNGTVDLVDNLCILNPRAL